MKKENIRGPRTEPRGMPKYCRALRGCNVRKKSVQIIFPNDPGGGHDE